MSSQFFPSFSRRSVTRTALSAAVLSATAFVGVAVPALVHSTPAFAAETLSETFDFNDTTQYFTVPPGVYALTLDASGGNGGPGVNFPDTPEGGDYGGFGDQITETVAVNPGDTLVVMVGGVGQYAPTEYEGGAGGLSSGDGMNGGAGGNVYTIFDGGAAGGGGGGTEVVDATTNAVLVVAAGGGGGGGANGAAPQSIGGPGGSGPGVTGNPGTSGYGAGGAGGPGGASGALSGNPGGTPEAGTFSGAGGGGGGGYFVPGTSYQGGGDGGAGGGWAAYDAGGGGGGAGASFSPGQDVTDSLNGLTSGNGQVVVSWAAPATPTSTNISLSPNQVLAGFQYEVSATVTGTGNTPPTGTVDFFENGVMYGSAQLNGATPDVATMTVTAPFVAGTEVWQAEFQGDTGATGSAPDAPSNSPVAVETVTSPIEIQNATTTAVSINPDPVATNKAYTVTATVAGISGITPTGTVTFSANGSPVGTATLNGANPDTATFTATAPSKPGSIDWTATYNGDANNDASTSNSVTASVAAKPTLTSVSPASGPAGTHVTLTGKNLTGATKVVFGTKRASFSCTTATTCTAIAPKALTGKVDIRLTTPVGETKASSAAAFTYTA
jgi:hypothetical protein